MPTAQQTSELQEILNILDPDIGHFADKLAKWMFKIPEFLRGLVFMLKGDIVQHLDFAQVKVVSPNIIDNTLRESVSDLVFTVPYRDTSQGDELTIYILLEHQSTVDRMMGYRLLTYMCQIWHAQLKQLDDAGVQSSHQRLRPILPIVFYTGERRWEAPVTLNAVMDVPEHMTPYVPTFKMLFFGVKQVNTDELTQTDHPFACLMTVLQKEQEDEDVMQRALESALTQLDTVKTENPTLHQNAMMYLSLIVRCRRDKNEQPQLLRMINTHTENEEVERIIMTGIEALIQEGLEQGKVEIHEQGKAEGLEQGKAEGLEQGKAEGLEQGRIYEKRTDVLKLVRYKFADISDTILNEINGIDDLVCLDDLFDQVLTAESFEDIDFSNNGQ